MSYPTDKRYLCYLIKDTTILHVLHIIQCVSMRMWALWQSCQKNIARAAPIVVPCCACCALLYLVVPCCALLCLCCAIVVPRYLIFAQRTARLVEALRASAHQPPTI